MALLLLSLWTACVQVMAQTAVPALTSRVVDATGSLPAESVRQLERQLATLEADTGAQIAVLMLGSTEGEPIESYAVRAFESWKLGRKGIDDGILFVVAKDDRAMRIEVGYGLEGAVTDVQVGRLIREHITPHFAQGDYAGGIQAGLKGLEALVRQESLPPPAASTQEGEEDWWSVLLLFGMVALFAPPVVLAVFGAFLGWLFLPNFGELVGAIAGGIGGGLIGFALSATGIRKALLKAARKGNGGPGGGWGGGGWGGGSGGGSSWGGGGGSSGGGGASGRW